MQQACADKQHIEIYVLCKKVICFMLFHFKMLWREIVSPDLTLYCTN